MDLSCVVKVKKYSEYGKSDCHCHLGTFDYPPGLRNQGANEAQAILLVGITELAPAAEAVRITILIGKFAVVIDIFVVDGSTRNRGLSRGENLDKQR